MVSRLGYSVKNCNDRVRGIGGYEASNVFGRVSVTITSVAKDYQSFTVHALCMDKIVGIQPTLELDKSVVDLTAGLDLADPEFYLPRAIDILLGSDIFGTLVGGDKINLQSGGLTAYKTVFGYMLLGPVQFQDSVQVLEDRDFLGVAVSDLLQKFWEVEEAPKTQFSAPLDDECEKFYCDNTTRLKNGRFVTKLPFLFARPILGESKSIAEKRFYYLERRFKKNELLYSKYVEFMREYCALGHMSVSKFNFHSGQEHYVIPHHAVLKGTGATAKIRVVFDGSCATSNGTSLNQCLHTGPKLHKDITDIIINFRRHQIVFVTDIKMMFRQTVIAESDRRYQLILWRESPDEPLLVYELNTNTYGLRSSPFIAIRSLLALAEQEKSRFPRAAEVLQHDIYVDDILSGADTLENAIRLRNELIDIMSAGGYELRKWISNSPALLRDLPEEHLQLPHLFLKPDGQDFISVLGVLYNPVRDSFTYRTAIGSDNKITKRTILSTIARMYDPSGWICPIIFWAKCLFQRLWLAEVSWDEDINDDLKVEWLRFKADLINIQEVEIPRCLIPKTARYFSLHGFCDASESGYAAAVYLRVISDREVSVYLVIAKSKVAPIRSRLTIPKLELCGALLLMKLLNHVFLCFQRTVELQKIVGWTDSSIALSWINTSPHMLQVFEANRVSQIQNSTVPITWRHISGDLNPSDCASRGCSASHLVRHPLWWGPMWLREPESAWPKSSVHVPTSMPGIRCLAIISKSPLSAEFLLNRYSSYDKLIAVTCWIRRFADNCKRKNDRICKRYITSSERRKAMLMWVRIIQQEYFSEEMRILRNGGFIKGNLRRLNPFIDEDGLLRVGGRLKHSDLCYGARHPLLLPKSGHFVNMLITYLHISNAHVGPNTLLAILQREFWILSARRVVRNVTFKCISCYKLKGITKQPFMGDLPRDRIVASRPFNGVGTDFAGPFFVKAHKFRNPKITKAYLCVFVCLATKSVHLEVVSDLSTEAFIAALSRFVSRRGLPAILRSDCGTNFKGANRYLREVYDFLEGNKDIIGQDLSRKGINWIFDPPACPAWGGLFEAAVKSAKTHLKRVIGETILTFEELATIFCKIEAILNSRPLCPLSTDPNDIEVLTPGHFLIGQPLNALPEYPLQEVKTYKLSRFQLLQQLSQRFWHRWHLEYLHTLQQRLKWTDETVPPKEGDLVLIKEDSVPPINWHRGRIVKLYPGSDGVVRVADVRLAQGTVLKRAVCKLSRLPID